MRGEGAAPEAGRSAKIAAGSRLAGGADAREAAGDGGVTLPVTAEAGKAVLLVAAPLVSAFGFAGFLPESGPLGFQFLFFSLSAASWSAVRCGTLLTNGTGTR